MKHRPPSTEHYCMYLPVKLSNVIAFGTFYLPMKLSNEIVYSETCPCGHLIELCNLGPKQGQIQECKKGGGGGGGPAGFSSKRAGGWSNHLLGVRNKQNLLQKGGRGFGPPGPPGSV